MVAKGAPLAQTMGVAQRGFDRRRLGWETDPGRTGGGGDATASAWLGTSWTSRAGSECRPSVGLLHRLSRRIGCRCSGMRVAIRRLAVVDRSWRHGGDRRADGRAAHFRSKRSCKAGHERSASAGVAPVVLMTYGTTESSIREASARTVEDGLGARGGLRLSASNAKRSEVASSAAARVASAETRTAACGSRHCAHVRDDGLLHRAGHLPQNGYSASLPIVQIVWARTSSGGDRSHRFAIPVAAIHAPVESSGTPLFALQTAILFDDRERFCRPRAASFRRQQPSRFSRRSSSLFWPDLCLAKVWSCGNGMMRNRAWIVSAY